MYFIGSDFHTRFQQISSRNPETGKIERRRIGHEGQAVREYYASLPKPVRVGIESMGYTLWFEQLLSELGIELVVGNASAIAAQRVKKQKYDSADADLILDLLEQNKFPTIYWPSIPVRDHRSLLYHRDRLVRLRTGVKNSLHAQALNYGTALRKKLFSRAGRKQLTALPMPIYMARQRADNLALFDQLNNQIKQLDAEIAAVLPQYPAAEQLRTHPGVGPVTALATVLILGPVDRFPNGKTVASYLGLIPSEHSSGGHQQFGPLTKQGKRLLRFLLIEAGLRASRLDPKLQRVFRRLVYRRGMPKAKPALGRKLAIRLYIMLRDGIDYKTFCQRGRREAAGLLPAGRA